MKHIKWDFDLKSGSCPRGGTGGPLVCPGGQKFIIFDYGHVSYQIDRDDE